MNPRIGLIVEGPWDEVVLPHLVRKILPNAVCRVVTANGHVPSRVGSLLPLVLRGDPDRVLAVSDADRHANTPYLLAQFRRSLRERYGNIDSRLRPVVLVQEMEALLLADIGALLRTCRSRSSSGPALQMTVPDIEALTDPKTKLQAILRGWRIQYDARVAGQIAELADAEQLACCCRQSWGSLRSALAGI